MNDDQLLRYSRQIMLPQVEVAGQQRIMDAHALIIGAGGLGAPVALYLAAAGVGTLTIADADIVELSNLQRQIIHRTADIGRPKVVSAAEKLAAVNPEVKVNTVQAAMEGEALDVAVRDASIVLDCTDNFTTRFAGQRRLRAAPQTADLRGGDPLRGPADGVRPRRAGQPLLSLPVQGR